MGVACERRKAVPGQKSASQRIETMAIEPIEPLTSYNASISPPQQSTSLKYPRQGLRDVFALWLLLRETWFRPESAPPKQR